MGCMGEVGMGWDQVGFYKMNLNQKLLIFHLRLASLSQKVGSNLFQTISIFQCLFQEKGKAGPYRSH